jgi:hypothetical protein
MDFGLAKVCESAEGTQSTKAKQELVSSKSSDTGGVCIVRNIFN